MYTIYTTENCIYCSRSKNLLVEHNKEYLEVKLDNQKKVTDFIENTGFTTVPQIYHVSGDHIGGYEQLRDHLNRLYSPVADPLE